MCIRDRSYSCQVGDTLTLKPKAQKLAREAMESMEPRNWACTASNFLVCI